jgi:hypothetical protein
MNITTPIEKRLLLVCAALALLGGYAFAQPTSSTYIGPDNGNWNDPANWSPAIVPNNSGTATFDVTIDNKTVNLDIDPTISSLKMPGDAPFLFSTDHSLKIGATDEVGFGDIEFTADQKDVKCDFGDFKAFSNKRLDETAFFLSVNAAAGRTATIQFNGADVVSNNGAPGFMGPGTTRITDENGLDAFRNMFRNEPLGFFQVGPGAGSHYTVAKSVTNEGLFPVFDGGTLTFAQNLTEVGDLRDPDDQQGGFMEAHSQSAGTPSRVIVNGVLTNYDAASKTLSRGRYNLDTAKDGIATFQVLGGAPFDIVHDDASILLNGPGAAILDQNGADALRNLVSSYRLRFIAHDFTTVGSLSSGPDGGITSLLAVRGDSHVNVTGDLSILGGGLELSPIAGYDLMKTRSDSQLSVAGNLSLTDHSYTRFEVSGIDGMARIFVNGRAALAGDLQIFVLPHASIMTSGSLTLLNADAITGAFSNVASGGRVTAYEPTKFLFKGQFDGAISGTLRTTYDSNSLVISDFQPHASMLNISTRLKVQTGDNALIGGFIVRGIGPKKIIVRGMGPSLSGKGVPGALQDPTLELHDSNNAIIASNDNWQDDAKQKAAIQATGIAPGDPRESAIVATLDPGSYTAVLRGANNTIGVGLVEAYDLDHQPAASELANVSTRGRVETGDDVIIGGYIVAAPEPAKLIVRGMGPSLAASNIAGSLQDPTLELHDASGAKIMSNDNWQDNAAQAALIQSAGLAPANSRESALAATLNPGNYTAIVRGKNDTQGIALVEFYKLN